MCVGDQVRVFTSEVCVCEIFLQAHTFAEGRGACQTPSIPVLYEAVLNECCEFQLKREDKSQGDIYESLAQTDPWESIPLTAEGKSSARACISGSAGDGCCLPSRGFPKMGHNRVGIQKDPPVVLLESHCLLGA